MVLFNEDILNVIVEMSVMDVVVFVEVMEEKFGVFVVVVVVVVFVVVGGDVGVVEE